MRILTYKDPSNLLNSQDRIKQEIKGVPHFCVSEVLVQGLIAKYGREEFNCIATIDTFVKNLFPSWLLETNKDVERFLEVASIINKLIKDAASNGNKEEEINILKAFQKNIGGIVEAIKYLWETEEVNEYGEFDLQPRTLIEDVFLNKVVKKVQDKGAEYWEPEWKVGISSLNVADAIRMCAIDEVRKEYIKEEKVEEKGSLAQKRENALAWLRRELKDPKKATYEKKRINESIQDTSLEENNKVVFHGLYRMKPIHFKVFEVLEQSGYEVILLNCYNPEYPKIYDLWNKLYCALSQRFNITELRIGDYSNQEEDNHSVGKVYGNLVEGRELPELTRIKGECEFDEYLTTMQFINHVSEVFDKTVDKEGHRHIGRMKEQFYGVNGIELNQVFRIFYPELFRKKSFMSFPLGQFIYYLHDMWKVDRLRLNHNGLIECLNMYDQSAIDVYHKIKVYIGLDRQKEGLDLDKVLKKIREIKGYALERSNEGENAFNDLSHFGYILEQDEYKKLENALVSLQRVAEEIFGKPSESAGRHYKKLLEMIEHLKKEPNLRSFQKEEDMLLEEIKERLKSVDVGKVDTPSTEDQQIATDISILKDTIDVYLGGSTEKDELNWLVRDFEQIDGDILLFHAPIGKKSKAETVHYGLISNQNMLAGMNSSGVWPLSKEMIKNKWAWETLEMIGESDQAYKRCMLFQGLYYIPKHIKVKLSYVKNVANLNNEEKTHDEYFLMRSIREFYPVKKDEASKGDEASEQVKEARLNKKETYNIRAQVQVSKIESKLISSCPYRYMYSAALNKPAYVYNDNTFLSTKFFSEYIKYRMKNGIKLEEEWQEEGRKILGDICTEKQIVDMVKRAYEDKNTKFNILNRDLPIYWVNKVRDQEKPSNYPKNQPWKERVSSYKGATKRVQQFLNETWDGFTEDDGTEYAVSEYICEYCSQKNICLYSYRLDCTHLIRKKE